jgi:predicted metal-dependent HD superfamily phosphohydrolase
VPINPKEFHQNIASSKQKGNSEKPTTKAQALLESPTISQVIESVRQSQNIILDTPIIKVNG